MAALTYSEKAVMAAKETFQQRVWMGFKSLATYHTNTTPAALVDYNARLQKRKRYAKQILSQGSNFGSQKAICEFLLNEYTTATPVLDVNNELADSELGTSGPTSGITFDNFAGVLPGDDTKAIEW
jgi:hypothetical protein